MTNSFTWLGTACAQYPIPVIVMSIGFAAGLCTGIQWLEVNTDWGVSLCVKRFG